MLTMTQPDSLDVQREVTAAATQWPDDMELAWLAYDTCNERRGCDRPAALANLQCGRRQRLRLAA